MLEITPHVAGSVPKVQTPVTAQQRRALRKLLRDLVVAINDLAMVSLPARHRSTNARGCSIGALTRSPTTRSNVW